MSESDVMAEPRLRGTRGLGSGPIFELALADMRAETIAVLLLCPMLLSVAWWNGFPLIFYDTGAYVLQGLGHVFMMERSPVYSLFLGYAGAGWSFWTVVIWQALMTSFVMTQFARAIMPRLRLWEFLVLSVFLVVATGLPWFVGQMEPDCMTALVVLCLYLLAFHTGGLGRIRSFALFVIAAFSIACHPSHLLLAGGLLVALALLRLAPKVVRRMPAIAPANLLRCAASLVVGVGLVFAANYDLTKEVFFNRSGAVFMFAGMLQDGMVKKLLDDTCPQAHYRLCAYKDRLPKRADAWLWGKASVFDALGRFNGTAAESTQIVIDSFERYPLENIRADLADTFEQLGRFRVGDQVEPQEWVLFSGLDRFVPHQMYAYMHARQQRGLIRFKEIDIVYGTVSILSLAGLALALWSAARRRDWNATVLPAFVFLALLGNAFICGALSNPHDRYQARLIWLPTFVLALTAREAAGFSLRRPVESGT